MAMLSVVSKALGEFNSSLKELGIHNSVTTFTASDFARTLTSNGRGSDHAWGGNHMVMGGAVGGGKIYGDYPELHIDNKLDVGRGSLIPTTSCDEYFAELALWFGVSKTDLEMVFPNIGRFYTATATTNPVGFINANTPIPTPNQNENKIYLPIVDNQRNSKVSLGIAGVAALTASTLSFRRRRMEELEE